MRTCFLHGWNSAPGGVKPMDLGDHGHEVLNPALPHEDFGGAVRIAHPTPRALMSPCNIRSRNPMTTARPASNDVAKALVDGAPAAFRSNKGWADRAVGQLPDDKLHVAPDLTLTPSPSS
jgi:hypothetical protein